MDLKNFSSAVTQLAEEKDIPKKKVIEIIETSVAAAYKKEFGEKSWIVKSKMDPKTGGYKFWQVKLVVDEEMILSEEEELVENKEEAGLSEKIRFNSDRHILIEDAKKIDKDISVGDEMETSLPDQNTFGRIAAQTAKQVILQKFKEVEREIIYNQYKSKEGEIVPGTIQRIEGVNIFIDLGKTLGILNRDNQIARESYRIGDRLKSYILRVDDTVRGPMVFLSRTDPGLLAKLFELETPEVLSGVVKIKSIAREPGSRSKVAVYSEQDGIDPIGAVVGQKGTRVIAVISELGGEKVDIVEYSETIEKFISNSLAPAKVAEVKIGENNQALVSVQGDQLSLAIGKDGQNVRLASKLTGWKIDVRGLGEDKNESENKDESECGCEDEYESKNDNESECGCGCGCEDEYGSEGDDNTKNKKEKI